MIFDNSTPLRLGMTGRFMGRRYSVAGRVVMSMDEGGETYLWNEFHLVADDGSPATLVHETTDEGVCWRMFTRFDPPNPLSVAEASSIQPGDSINLDGRELRVTLVDHSVVCHIEGQAPAGVELGDVARYFNAETGNVMIVVSWSGDEVEFYRGVSLPSLAVARAFGLDPAAAGFADGGRWWGGGSGAGPARTRRVSISVIVFVAAGVLASRSSGCRGGAPSKPTLPPASLSVGASGTLGGTTWRIRGHTIAEIAQVGRLFDQHEFHLVSEAGERALLVRGSRPGVKDWTLFRPLEPAPTLTPVQAAAQQVGNRLVLGEEPVTVTDILRATWRQSRQEGLPDLIDGRVFYGFTAYSKAGPVLVRWNADHLTCHLGKVLAAEEVKAAFAPTHKR